MELKINVNDNMFNEVINKELEALPKEKIQEIIIEGINDSIKKNNSIIENILFCKDYCYNSKKLTETGKQIIASAVSEDTFTEAKEILKKLLEENGTEILAKLLSEMFVAHICVSQTFQEELSAIVRNNIYDVMRDNNQSNFQ